MKQPNLADKWLPADIRWCSFTYIHHYTSMSVCVHLYPSIYSMSICHHLPMIFPVVNSCMLFPLMMVISQMVFPSLPGWITSILRLSLLPHSSSSMWAISRQDWVVHPGNGNAVERPDGHQDMVHKQFNKHMTNSKALPSLHLTCRASHQEPGLARPRCDVFRRTSINQPTKMSPLSYFTILKSGSMMSMVPASLNHSHDHVVILTTDLPWAPRWHRGGPLHPWSSWSRRRRREA